MGEKDEMITDFEPIRVYLEKKLDTPIDMVVTDNYASLIEGMKNGTIDIGWYGAFSFIAAEGEMELTPLIVEQRKDSGIYYKSLMITLKDSGIETIEQLKQKRYAFVDSGSTSGFILPYALFKSRNIDIKQYFSEIHYSGNHHQVPIDIKNNVVDAGSISSIQYELLIDEGKINEEDFRVIWQSDDIPGSPYVSRSDLDKKTKEKFIEAMLNIHNENPNELAQYDNTIEKYLEVDDKDYNSIRNIATILGKERMEEYFLKGE